MHNIQPLQIIWPSGQTTKLEAIEASHDSEGLLCKRANYVLVRRISSNDDGRRLIAAPLLSRSLQFKSVAFENHLNYIHAAERSLGPADAIGLAALLSSPILNRYFRTVGGTTQVNASELLGIPLPPLRVIKAAGSRIQSMKNASLEAQIEVVHEKLLENGLLSSLNVDLDL